MSCPCISTLVPPQYSSPCLFWAYVGVSEWLRESVGALGMPQDLSAARRWTQTRPLRYVVRVFTIITAWVISMCRHTLMGGLLAQAGSPLGPSWRMIQVHCITANTLCVPMATMRLTCHWWSALSCSDVERNGARNKSDKQYDKIREKMQSKYGATSSTGDWKSKTRGLFNT